MTAPASDLEVFEALARGRRSVRHFLPDPLPDGLIERLLDCARWAPSGYNLQPAHFVVVDEPEAQARLREACLGQPQVEEAPVTVVFVGDRDVVASNFERVLAMERRAGAIDEDYESLLRRIIPLAFNRGPAGVGRFWKRALPPVARRFRPVPELPAADERFWLVKQVMLAAMNFMLAASAAGLATVPMEGFDETRVRRVLDIPRRHVVCVVIPVGLAADEDLKKTRLPLDALLHRNRW